MRISPFRLFLVVFTLLMVGAVVIPSRRAARAPAPAVGSQDAAFTELSGRVIAGYLRHNPSAATDLGIHAYDSSLEDFSRAGIDARLRALREFRGQVAAVDAAALTLPNQLDRQQLLAALDTQILNTETVKPWARNPDTYSTAITNAAYVIMKRGFAPAPERLKTLIAREQKMPAALGEAQRNLENPPKIYTEIALEQIDGNMKFFRDDVPAAFTGVSDAALKSDFQKSNNAVIAALGEYKKFLQSDLLPRSNGSFAIGPDTYTKWLAASEMIDLPIDRLLAIAEADRQRNETAFQSTARQIDATRPADAVLASLQVDHPPAAELLKATQNTLDSLSQFIIDRHIVTIPPSPPAHVKETPPFMRSTTSASMDTPGPFEKTPLEAFFNMTLPDPRWPAAKQADFMRQWYFPAMSNVAVHEVYPGHYLQFLYAKEFPSDVRKVFGASTNAEGWAHYCEQMMLDEGFHAGNPKYQLAQLQDALLRDVRFIAGIKMHTQGMTVDEATKLFETAAHQPRPVAVSEAKRGTSDPLYGYYTMGKLMIRKLRDDFKAKQGSAYTLQGFHDAFVKLGPLPLPLVRRAMLGETGTLF